jgi:hypothetical protein
MAIALSLYQSSMTSQNLIEHFMHLLSHYTPYTNTLYLLLLFHHLLLVRRRIPVTTSLRNGHTIVTSRDVGGV